MPRGTFLTFRRKKRLVVCSNCAFYALMWPPKARHKVGWKNWLVVAKRGAHVVTVKEPSVRIRRKTMKDYQSLSAPGPKDPRPIETMQFTPYVDVCIMSEMLLAAVVAKYLTSTSSSCCSFSRLGSICCCMSS